MSDESHDPSLPEAPLLAAYAVVFAIGLITYAHSAFGLALVADQWLMIHDPMDFAHWMFRIGRWGQVILAVVAHSNTFAPGVTLATCLGLLLLGVHQLRPHFGLSTPLTTGIFATLLILCPVLSAHMAYRSNHLGLGVSFALTAAAFGLCIDFGRDRSQPLAQLILPAGMLTFAFGTQQSIALLLATLTCAWFVRHLGSDSPQSAARHLGALAGTGLFGIGSSLAIASGLRLRYGLSGLDNGPYNLGLASTPAELASNLSVTPVCYPAAHPPPPCDGSA